MISRRGLLARTGLAVAGAAATSCGTPDGEAGERPRWWPLRGEGGDWGAVRRQFALSGDHIHMSAMLIASHPAPVREAIERHRRGLDANPVRYLERNNNSLTRAAMSAAGRYLGVDANDVALTDSTTMGVGLIYGSLRLRPGQEILTTEHDYFVTHDAAARAARRSGATLRRITLFEDARTATPEEIVARIARAITPATRALGLTWVHSSTGLKLPLRAISEAVQEANRGRDEDDRVLICLDGVHGFGVEDQDLSELGCDFLAAGCHKWLFGPRGTGVVAATRQGWRALAPSIPSFIDDGAWNAWLSGREPPERVDGRTLTPGGFKAFEHQWALTEAFEFHRALGRRRVAARTAELAGQLKAGLAGIRGVTLRTPRSDVLSAGIVSFDVAGMDPNAVVRRLRARRIVASAAPYATQHVRLTPSIRNSPQEVEVVLGEIRRLAG